MNRALLWLLLGFVGFVLGVMLTAPELLGAQDDQLAGLVGIVVLAGLPGLVLLAVLAIRRRGEPDDQVPDQRIHPISYDDPTDPRS